jgi:hypothetical protein
MPLILLLVAAALVLDFLPWIVAGLLLWAGVYVVRSVLASAAVQRELERRRLAVIAARADAQHAAVLAGDLDTGVYGEYQPAVSAGGMTLTRVARSGADELSR